MSALTTNGKTASEVAWTHTGMWVGTGRSRRAPPIARGLKHQSGYCPEGCGRFECSACKRIVPWCHGGSDDSLCDDCWCETVQPAAEVA